MQAIIVDDEKHCREVLSILLKKYCPNVNVLAQCSNGETALIAIEQYQPDIVFLDIEMPEMNGFELLEKCCNKNFSTVFTTAYNEYAIQAIRNAALDYLLKPIDVEELKIAVVKCDQAKSKNSNLSNNMEQFLNKVLLNSNHYKERFLVQSRNKWIPIEVNAIAYFHREFINYLTTFHSEKYVLTQATLEEVESELDNKFFFRANRQFIVNINAIENLKVLEDGAIQIQLKEPLNIQIEVSKKKAPAFRKWLS